jgi:CP family cyanate transporter-like MFS transporter
LQWRIARESRYTVNQRERDQSMSQTSKLSPYRWVIETLMLLLLTAQSFAWLAPAPILQEIRNGLGISLSSAGLIISIIALCIGIFSLLGALVFERIGALRALVIGIWLMALGQIASGYAPNFVALLACRVLEGIGYGLVIAPPGVLTMQWFGEGEWPYINMINFSFGYVGLTAVFRATPALFAAVGSWRMTLLWYGIGSAGVALLWTTFGREHRVEIAAPAPGAIEAPAERGSALMEVARMRNVLLVAAGLFGGMWVFQIYTAFLPEFFRTYRGMSMAEALMMFPDPTWIRLSLVLVGIGSAGSLAAITTLLMELPGMNPTRVGAALGFVWAIGYFGAFISPFLGGALAAHIGLRTVMLGFLVFQFLPIVTMYFLPETGPGRPRYEIEPAPPNPSPVISRERLGEGSAKQATP